jgi:spectinomycin phosphotransferase
MKFEAWLDKPGLMEFIWQAYGYRVTALTFLPEGLVGYHYIADCLDGKRLFVTLLGNNYLAMLEAGRLDFTLKAMNRLYECDLFTAQPAICKTREGNLKTYFLGQPLIIHEYIDGGNLGGSWPYPSDVLTVLGRLTAQLHNATEALGMEVPYVEEFLLPFEEPLFASLRELEKLPENSRPGKVKLRKFILPRKAALLHRLAHLHELGTIARRLNPPKVLVHTDMTPNNILRTPRGELFIVDWEGIMLAPAEYDLFIFAGEGFATLLAEYVRHAKTPSLHPELFAYYFHRRNLEDINGFLISILHENTSAEEDRFDLDLLTTTCVSDLPFLETSLEWAAEQIQTVIG